MHQENAWISDGTVGRGGAEVLDSAQLDQASGGLAPLLAAAAWGFGVGFAGTAALIAGVWASE